MFKRLFLLIFAAQLPACGLINAPPAPPADASSINSAMVYGFVDAGNEVVEQIDLVEYGKVYIPPFAKPPRVLVYDNGMFMAENIPPGKYIIAGVRTNKNNFNMARSKRNTYQNIIHVKPGQMHFVGSFQVRVTQQGKLNFGSFKVTQMRRPGERDLLKQVYRVTEGTVWQNKAARRLKQLRQ